MTDDAPRPAIRPAEGLYAIRAGGAVLAESRNALAVSFEGDEGPAIYVPRAEAGELFLEPTETRFEIPGLGRARQYDIIAKSGPIKAAAWALESPAPGAEALGGHVAFDTARVAVERL